MAEHNRLSFAPVFIKNFDVARIFLTNFDVWHLRISFFVLRFPSNRWRPDVCGERRQHDLPPFPVSQRTAFVGLATSHYAGSKQPAHHKIECFSATTLVAFGTSMIVVIVVAR